MTDHAKDERLTELIAKLDEKVQEIEAGLPADVRADWQRTFTDNPEFAALAKGVAGDLVLEFLRDIRNESALTTDDLIDRLVDRSVAARDQIIHLHGIPSSNTFGTAEIELLKKQVKRQLKTRRADRLPATLSIPADRVFKAVFDAHLPGGMKETGDDKGFFAGYTFSTRRGRKEKYQGEAEGVIGYADNPGELIWKFAQSRGALIAKLQLALWARVYHENGATPGKFIELSIVQLCDDLGYKRKKGGHRREVKIEVGQALRSLFELQIEAHCQVKGQRHRLSGPLWAKSRQLESEELFEWVPVMVKLAPGDWFHTPEWRSLNRQVASVSAGALRLSTAKNDQAALYLACYFSTLARMNGNRPTKRLKAVTLAEKSGLIQTYTRPGRLQEAVEGALERLKEVGVIKEFVLDTIDRCADPDDLDDPDTLATLADDGVQTKKNWHNQVYVIEWPDDTVKTGLQIAEKRVKHQKKRTAIAKKTPR